MLRNKTLPTHPRLIAIVGGSGAGKTRLADELQKKLGHEALRLSLDNFYRDRADLTPLRRAQINFDHPRAIDWTAVEKVLARLARNRPTRIPRYDFSTHCRLHDGEWINPKPIILMDGLWLLLRRSLRKIFQLGIFLECPAQTRLQRRLDRDVKERGRTATSVCRQFVRTVAPMHNKFVAPQIRWAQMIFRHGPSAREITQLAEMISPTDTPSPVRGIRRPAPAFPSNLARPTLPLTPAKSARGLAQSKTLMRHSAVRKPKGDEATTLIKPKSIASL